MVTDRNADEAHETASGVDAVVVADTPVTLWKNGATIEVSSRSVPALTAQGWLTGLPDDLPALRTEVGRILDQLSANLDAYIAGVQGDGYIDTADQHAYASAHKSLQLLVEKCAAIDQLVHAAWPIRAGETKVVTHNGDQHAHDPSQHPLIDPEGNLRAVDPAQVEHLTGLGWQEVPSA